ncbi:hypothetical protein [Streptomyces sviceus]|uniref:hypothetical protein n=1 Tax=Streptomyces sviceus TaxID=285530 RepID=UPI003333BB30
MDRATAVLSDWDNHLSHSAASKRAQAQAAEIARLRSRLGDNRHGRQRLQDEVDAAATVIAALLAESTALREQIAQRSAVVIPLDRAHATRECSDSEPASG